MLVPSIRLMLQLSLNKYMLKFQFQYCFNFCGILPFIHPKPSNSKFGRLLYYNTCYSSVTDFILVVLFRLSRNPLLLPPPLAIPFPTVFIPRKWRRNRTFVMITGKYFRIIVKILFICCQTPWRIPNRPAARLNV